MEETVLIKFETDYTELDNAQTALSKVGKIDASQFSSLNKSIKSTATDTKGLIAEFKKVATTATLMGKSVENAFGEGIQDALDEAGVSMDEFTEALKNANEPSRSLFAELRSIKNEMAALKARGEDTGEQFRMLRERAGLLSDSLLDANQEIKNMGSDTRHFDNLVGSISAAAGGFAAIQGAAALFGDESEDLQKALLKVNAALALSTGLQQIATAVQKEGSLAKLADTIATGGQTVAIKLFAFVMEGATVKVKLFRAALLATGIGAIVFLLLEAASAFGLFGSASDDAKSSTDKLNESLEKQKEHFDDLNDSIDRAGRLRRANLRKQGADEKKIFEDEQADRKKKIEESERDITLTQQQLAKKRVEIEENQAKLDKVSFGSIIHSKLKDQKKALKEELDILTKAEKDKQDIRQGFIDDRDLSKADFEADEADKARKLAEENAKKLKDLREKAAAEARLERRRSLNDELAELERRLLLVEKNSQAEIDIKKKIVAQKAKIELDQEKLKVNQIALINETALNDQIELQKGFNKKLTEEELQAQINTNAALLEGLEITAQEKLRLQIENIVAASEIEIIAAEGNASKILSIEAKKYADIRALKIAAIDAERAADTAASANQIARIKNTLNKLAADRDADLNGRVAAIRTIQRYELEANQDQIDDNQRKFDEGLISAKEYNDKLKQLSDERVNIEADASERVNDIRKEDNEKRKADVIAIAEQTVQIAGQMAEFFANLSSLQLEREQQQIDAQKRALDALVEAGAITEKEAKIRAQQIEILERAAKSKQAQREKQAAVFNALLGIPQAVLAGLKQGGPVLAAIYGALAAAQAAIIISRPVPKFFRGKKDRYEGPGEVADMGSEIVERNGRMFLYTKPTKTYLGATDKVYTAAETRAIMHNTNINTTIPGVKADKFDYERMAKSIPKQSVSINIEKDFISEAVAEGLSKTNYFNKRYNF